MVNFSPLTAEILSTIWGTPANFNWFRVLAAASSSGRQLNFAALNRGRHLCSAGRPSRWTLAHILVELFSLALTVEALQGKTCQDSLSGEGRSLGAMISGRRGLHWGIFLWFLQD